MKIFKLTLALKMPKKFRTMRLTGIALLLMFCLHSCKKEEQERPVPIEKILDKNAVQEWISENPISQIVEPNWDSLKIFTTKTGLQIAKLPLTASNILGSPNPDNVLVNKGMVMSSNSSEKNPNFSDKYPPQIFFTKDDNGKLKAHFINFVPDDKFKENGKDGLWTGKAYEWNMKGDTMLTVEYVKSKVKKGTFSKSTTSAVSKNSSTHSNNSIRSIWQWLKDIVGAGWQNFMYICYHLGIPGGWIYDDQGVQTIRTWNWETDGGGNQQTTDYIAGDPSVMGYFFAGGGYILPAVTEFDRLISQIQIDDDNRIQDLALRPDIQTALTSYLAQNVHSPLTLEYLYWAQAYLIANPGVDASTFVPNNLNNYYTNSEMESIINSMADPLTDDVVDFYLVVKYKGSKIFDLSRYSKASTQTQIGSYQVAPMYSKEGAIIFYSTYRNSSNGIEYLIKPSLLTNFTNKVDYYTSAADMVYLGGVPSYGMIQMMSGDRINGLLNLWGQALKSAEYWVYLINCFIISPSSPKVLDALDDALPSAKPYTRSSLEQGRNMHAQYKVGVADNISKFKEYTGVQGVRPDFVDFNTRTIFELKPNNPRQIAKGNTQLNNYRTRFEQQYGGFWNIQLDLY